MVERGAADPVGSGAARRTRCTVVRNAYVVGGPAGDVAFNEAGVVLAEPGPDAHILDLGGRLVAPRFAEPHVHLDRAFSLSLTGWNRSGTLPEAIDRYRASVESMTVEALAVGARRALEWLSATGVGHVRTHTAVGEGLGFRAWEAVEAAAAEVPQVSVEQVIMPLGGIAGNPDGVAVAKEAAARGAVALGGAAWLADDPGRATRAVAELAAELGIGLDLHVDETDDASVDTIPDLAAAVAATGLSGRAVAAHCCS
ncbi:MAG: hypothetical protein ACRDKW_10360, partial [Actinomycetota bacterium]